MIRWLLHADCFGLNMVPCLFFRSWQALNLCFLFSFFFKDNTLAFIKSEGELKEILKEVKYNGIFSNRDHNYHSDWYSWDSRWLKLKNHERVLSKNSLKEVKLTAQCGKSRWKWFGLNIGVRFEILSIVLVLFTSKLYAEFNKWFNSKPQCATVETEQAVFFLSKELRLPFGQMLEFSRLWFQKYHGTKGKMEPFFIHNGHIGQYKIG